MNNLAPDSCIRLILLESQSLFRASLGRLLATEPDFEVVGECGTSAEALEVLMESAVDLVLLDFDLGTEHGNDFISSARASGYQGRFLIVAGSADVRNSATALKLGASGIFLKSGPPDRLVQAIRLVGNGGIWLDQKITHLLADQLLRVEELGDHYARQEDPKSSGPLDDRERNVLLGILGGLTNRKIGYNLGITESTVKNTVQQLFRKAGVKTRGQLVRVALEGSFGGPPEFNSPPHEEIPGDLALKSHQ